MEEYILTKKSTLTQIADSIRAIDHSDAGILVTDLAARFSEVSKDVQNIKDAYAIILVEYPAGSICTCSKGTEILKAGNTYGAWAFGVNSAGTWTLTCTNGEKSITKDIVISEQYQCVSHTLVYKRVLFDASNITGWSTDLNVGGYGKATYDESGFQLTGSAAVGGDAVAYWVRGRTSNHISRADSTKLCITTSLVSVGNGIKLFASNSLPSGWLNSQSYDAEVSISEVGNTILDISSLGDSLYFGVIVSGNSKINASEIWLE